MKIEKYWHRFLEKFAEKFIENKEKGYLQKNYRGEFTHEDKIYRIKLIIEEHDRR